MSVCFLFALSVESQIQRPEGGGDIILALTADEEGGAFNGVDWLVKNHRDLVDAELVLNHDGGGVIEENGKLLRLIVDATEKVFVDYQLTSLNPGGHSSMPSADNAIYHLADALARLEHYTFPFELTAVTRAELAGLAKNYPPEKAALVTAVLKEPPDQAAIAKLSAEDRILNATIRTTCVATRLAAGHANNALPQTATANVNCRIFPGHSPEQIRQELVKIMADPKVTVSNVQTDGSIAPSAAGRCGPGGLLYSSAEGNESGSSHCDKEFVKSRRAGWQESTGAGCGPLNPKRPTSPENAC